MDLQFSWTTLLIMGLSYNWYLIWGYWAEKFLLHMVSCPPAGWAKFVPMEKSRILKKVAEVCEVSGGLCSEKADHLLHSIGQIK